MRGVQQLNPGSTMYRLRVGTYRILFDLHYNLRLIVVQSVERRSDRTYR